MLRRDRNVRAGGVGELGEGEALFGQAVIVRNGTDATIVDPRVSGAAYDAAGELVDAGSSLQFAPSSLEPGEWGVAEVNLTGPDRALAADYDWHVAPRERYGQPGRTSLPVLEAQFVPSGYVDEVRGTVMNDTGGSVDFPTVIVACFDEAGTFQAMATGIVDERELDPDESSPFAAAMCDVECESFVVFAAG